MQDVKVIGAGLAGCEAAWQLAERGVHVTLMEMKPQKMTPAHHSADFAELVCSNSLRGDRLENAVGLLKEELRRLGSLILQCAEANRVEAGGALAVDRYGFSGMVTEKIRSHPNITVAEGEVTEIPEPPVIIATGPLTSDTMSEAIHRYFGGADYLSFFDAAAPLVSFDSIDMSRAWFASRYDRGESDYVNCAMERDEYAAFVEALTTAEEAEVHGFEDSKVFEGCMPVEVMARRGFDTLRYGPLKPVGLKDPKTGREPYAVVQLRKDNAEGSVYNLVGFQTHLKFPEQKRVFSMIPALHDAEFVRYGVMHRNTFLCSPKLLDRYYADRREPLVAFAGQMTGVEGYVESTASGYLAGVSMAAKVLGGPLPDFPRETAIGALAAYISDESVVNFQPMNVNFGIMPALGYRVKGKANKNLAIANRSLAVIDAMTGKTKEESHENSR
ncbi:MAG: methylenetetrahydrofolate--tRNA-(uracil(54)-C(5))-methyltransferase (FADH(2)-oxidizing) TrmFO [Oscillospiraceae bacterium]|nr:methylenetetrahydrofolate--tRNA-(uracil(54)-C(5))-methyltransferase (FADH(2)-oxidizing) TrmFO [Oscillospiraceae bacterium]